MERWIILCGTCNNTGHCCFIPASQATLSTVDNLSTARQQVNIQPRNRDSRWIRKRLLGIVCYRFESLKFAGDNLSPGKRMVIPRFPLVILWEGLSWKTCPQIMWIIRAEMWVNRRIPDRSGIREESEKIRTFAHLWEVVHIFARFIHVFRRCSPHSAVSDYVFPIIVCCIFYSFCPSVKGLSRRKIET